METLTNSQIEQLNDFNSAKKIALTIPKGQMRRARSKNGNVPSNYIGFKNNEGRMFVIGDSENDIQNPDVYLFEEKLPAREIFGDFSVMSK